MQMRSDAAAASRSEDAGAKDPFPLRCCRQNSKKLMLLPAFFFVPYDLPTYGDIIKINDAWKTVTEIIAILSGFDSCTENHSSCS